MRILVVENDRLLSETLVRRLSEAGNAVDLFATVADAEAAWRVSAYDLCIVDVMLDDGDGRALVRSARAAGLTTPTLMLTARDEIGDRVSGLDAGADDYLVKPFDVQELPHRVENQIASRRRLAAHLALRQAVPSAVQAPATPRRSQASRSRASSWVRWTSERSASERSPRFSQAALSPRAQLARSPAGSACASSGAMTALAGSG